MMVDAWCFCIMTGLCAVQVKSLPVPEVQFAEWSPTGAYFTTAKRGVKGPDNVPLPNVQVGVSSCSRCNRL